MAGEITVVNKIQVLNGNFKFPFNGMDNKIMDQITIGGGLPGEVSCITTGQGTSIDLTPLSAGYGGWILLLNPDASNYVEWGPNSAGNIIVAGEVLAGEAALWRMTRTTPTLRIRANTAAVRMQIFAFYK